ncbi:hypothetical protein G4B88_014092 [Cannabis sativa]|uniref:Pentatricopeptide repeat-containing protein n=1 Tax=Cannabis sativa TaxID=3483 RepID=A0A7J6I2I7_CANSA|nr:hypothetical protein G4B88_014092 [Cannabis sativa]
MPSNSSLLTLNRKLAHLTRANRYSDALQFFTQSQSQSPKPDHYTISTLITATSNLAHITFGNQLHAYAIRTGLKAFPHSKSLEEYYKTQRKLVDIQVIGLKLGPPLVQKEETRSVAAVM